MYKVYLNVGCICATNLKVINDIKNDKLSPSSNQHRYIYLLNLDKVLDG